MDRDPNKYKQASVIGQLDYSEGLTDLLNRGIKVWSLYTVLYYSAFALVLGAIGFHIYMLIRSGTFSQEILPISIGVILGFISIIPHELIHAVIYKTIGASDIQFKANWKKLYFTTSVEMFVVSKNEYMILALSPFIVLLSLALLFLYFQINGSTALFFILIHMSICKGDFAMVNIMTQMHSNVAYIYDDSNLEKIYLLRET